MPKRIFIRRTIASLYVRGMLAILLLVALFISFVLYTEYSNFENEANSLRKQYIEQQKETIVFDVERVLRFIKHEYSQRHKKVDEAAHREQIMRAIEQLYGRQDGTGYIFIYSFEGVCLSDPVQRHNVGKNLYDFRDRNNVAVIKDLIDVSRQKKGGFVDYVWVKPTTGKPGPKVSYAKSFEPWGWMVGTGVYLDEVEKLIAAERTKLEARLKKYIIQILLLTGILYAIALVGVGLVGRIVSREIDTFSRFFKSASTSHTTIDPEQIKLDEFKAMVDYINDMVDTIHKRKNHLRELNALLEIKVEEKTEDLSRQNVLLAQEKHFSESLVKAQDSFIKQAIHEINTPLAVIMTHIDMFRIKEGENRYLFKIEAAAKMIANIYDDLSYMVKKDRIVYEPQWIDFSSFLHDRIAFFEEIAQGNQRVIVANIEPEVIIHFNDVELQRIVDNNLSNAIKYAKKDTEIEVRLHQEDKQIILGFTTDSKPIEDTQRIFEPFHQETQEVEAQEGFGLGLEIVRSICDKHDVAINVQSDEEATLFIYLFRRDDESTSA